MTKITGLNKYEDCSYPEVWNILRSIHLLDNLELFRGDISQLSEFMVNGWYRHQVFGWFDEQRLC